MDLLLYEKPMKLELIGYNLFVNGTQHPKATKTLPQMTKVLMDRIQLESVEWLDMYYMYRNVYKVDTIRYDITAIPAQQVGEECAKTHGHYHPRSEDGLAYPEVYQVLHGNAVFIMQKRNRNGSVDVSIVDAKEREAVILPPGYGHVSVNKGKDPLVLANAVYDRFEAIYHDYEESRGAAYYYLKEGNLVQNGEYVVEKNERLTARMLNERHKFECNDILTELIEKPEKFAFLQKPSLLWKE